MSVWVIQQTLTPAEEERIHEREGVYLPFDNIPDLSQVASQSNLRELLVRVHPEMPPESIMLMLDRIWAQFSGLQMDDVIAVPLKGRKVVAIGRVNGRYEYQTGKDGNDVHRVPVEWYPVLPTIASFGKFKQVFERSQRMFEISDKDTRIKIYDKLPHKFNRFARWKWIALILVFMQSIAFILGMFRR